MGCNESFDICYQSLLRRLSVREHSKQELLIYGQQKHFPEEIVCLVVDRLLEQGYLNETRFTEAFIRDSARAKRGGRWIQQKLKQKGVEYSVSQIDAIIGAAFDESEVVRAREYIERRYAHCQTDLKIQNRAKQALVRRGFSFDTVTAVFQKNRREDEVEN